MSFTANFNSSIVGTDPSSTQQATIASAAQSNLLPYLEKAATSEGLASGTCLLGNISFSCDGGTSITTKSIKNIFNIILLYFLLNKNFNSNKIK